MIHTLGGVQFGQLNPKNPIRSKVFLKVIISIIIQI